MWILSIKRSFLIIGALTSKPYAFKARPWELSKYLTIDFMDGLGLNIVLDIKDFNIMRIHPGLNLNLEEQFITDKIRYLYDGLKRQRLVNPMKRKWIGYNSYLLKTTWSELKTVVFEKYFKYKGEIRFNFVFGNILDLETLTLIKFYKNHILNKNSIKNMDFREDYLFMSEVDVKSLENYKVIFLVGNFLRFEYPLLNVKIRKNVLNKQALVVICGLNYNYMYEVVSLGNSVKHIRDFLEYKNIMINLFFKTKDYIVILGRNILNYNENLIKYFGLLFEKRNVYQLLDNISITGKYELALSGRNIYNSMFKNWLFFLDNDEECNILNDNFYDYYDFDLILYQGHHGDRKSNIADLILPSVYPFEKNSSFINIMGNYKYIKYIYKYGNNLSDARVDWKILNMLFFLFKGIFIKEIDNLKYKYIPLNLDKNLLLNLDKIYYKVLLYNRGILNYKDDFYLTDNITKASLILTLTSSRIKKRNNNWN